MQSTPNQLPPWMYQQQRRPFRPRNNWPGYNPPWFQNNNNNYQNNNQNNLPPWQNQNNQNWTPNRQRNRTPYGNNPPNPPYNGQGPVPPRFQRNHYCWSHGNCAHDSKDCMRKFQGHQDAATFENRMGGSNKNCQWIS